MNVLGHFDRADLERRFAEAGLLAAIRARGFSDLALSVGNPDTGLPHLHLHGSRQGRRVLLLDACLAEATVRSPYFRERDFGGGDDVDLLVVYWVREQDPTREFVPERPPLPLQEHPGLGVLPLAFRVVRDLAVDLGKDGVACVPKFYHDAYIFYRSRLFLFLDGREQGRFERLLVDLATLPLGHASLAMLDGHVRDDRGCTVRWAPGFQVFPIAQQLTAYFNSGEYAAAVDVGLEEHRFRYTAMDLLPTVIDARNGGETKRDGCDEEEGE